jgi:hypothetical protein
MEKKSRWQRFKEWWTIDHVVDGVVDIALLLFDVITSPILITIRIIRHFIGDWFVGGLKRIIKSVVHWFAHKREYRLEHGHGIFRTYWYLILTSPIIFFILFILLAMITGIAQDLPEMLELLLRGCQEGSQYWCNTDLW